MREVHDGVMIVERQASADPSGVSGDPRGAESSTLEPAGGLCPSALVGSLIAGGVAWFGLLRLVTWAF